MLSPFFTVCLKCCLFILCSFIVKNVSGIRCFVCGNGEGELPCSEFEKEEKFIAECHPEYQACRTANRELEKSIFSRSCARISRLEDCKVANDVQYCYCSTNLCNSYLTPPDTDDTDDEDLVEGSGIYRGTSDKNSFDSDIPVQETPATPAKTAPTSGCVLHYSFRNRTVLFLVSTFVLLFISMI